MYIQFHMLINFLQKISMFLHGNINLKAGKYKIWKLYLFHYIWFKSQSSFIFEIWQLKAVGLGHMMCIFLYTHHKSNMAANEFIWFGDSLVHLAVSYYPPIYISIDFTDMVDTGRNVYPRVCFYALSMVRPMYSFATAT